MPDNVERYELQLAADPASAQGAIAQINAVQASLANVGTTAQAIAQQMLAAGHTIGEVYDATGVRIEAASKKGLLAWTQQEQAADGFLEALKAIQQQESGAPATGLLGMGDTAASLGFMQALEQIQASEATAQQDITAQMEQQTFLAERLTQAALARESAEAGFVADLRQEAFSGGTAGADEGGGGGISLGGARGALRASGMLLGANAGGGALRALGSVVTLSSVLGPLGIAAALGAEALRGVAAAEQQAAEAAKLYTDSLSGVVGETKDDIQKQIQGEQQRQAAFQESQANLQKFADEAVAAKEKLSQYPTGQGTEEYLKTIADINARLSQATNGTVTGLDQLHDALTSGQAEIDGSTGKINFLTLAIGTAAVAANTAAAALKQLSDDQVSAAQKDIQINNMTLEERKKKADQDMADYNILQQQLDQGNLTYDAAVALRAQQQDLLQDYRQLTGIESTYADQLEREAAAKESATNANQNYLDEITDEISKRQEISQTEQDIVDLRAAEAAKEVGLAGDLQAKIGDIESGGAEKRAEIAQNNADALAKIERQFARDYQTAVGNRDAFAAQQAEQKHADDLNDQAKANQRALDQQAAAEQKSLDQAQAAYDDQIRQLRASLQEQVASKQRALQQEQTDLANILAAERALTQQGFNGLIGQHTDFWSEVAYVTGVGIHNALDMISHFVNGGGANLPPVIETPGSTTPFPAPTPHFGAMSSSSRQIVIQVSPTDGSEATNNFLRALDKMLPDNLREG